VRRGLRIVLWVAASVAMLGVVGICVDSLFDWESSIGLCKVPVRSVTPSPDGKQSAVVFEVYCGPLPPDNTHVSIIAADRTFSWKHDPSFLVLGGSYALKVQWTDTTSLDVSVPAEATIIRQEPHAGIITVSYRPVL
jgi:hypothetical protein